MQSLKMGWGPWKSTLQSMQMCSQHRADGTMDMNSFEELSIYIVEGGHIQSR